MASKIEWAIEAERRGVIGPDEQAWLNEARQRGETPEAPGYAASATRGAAQGATLGFADEIAGAGAAMWPGGQDYTEARDESRERFDAARAANPKTFLAGELLGGATTGGVKNNI